LRLGRLAFAGLLLLGIVAPSRAADPANGRYLAEVAGCGRCHTDIAEGASPYAGGRVLDTEFGRLTTPNITPDRATGIGGWSAADFIRAMRWGIAPDDSHYLPVFPFPYYNRLTDQDLADIKAFLDSLPPVRRSSEAGAGPLALWRRVSRRHDRPLRPVPYADDLARGARSAAFPGRGAGEVS